MASLSIGDVKAGLSGENPRFLAKEHQGTGGRFYRTFNDVYEGEERLKDGTHFFYQCTKCKDLMKLDPKKGTAPLIRHADACDPLPSK